MNLHNPLFMALAMTAKSRIKELNVHQVSDILLKNSLNKIIIDVREDHEWQTGHLPNAVHLSKGILERDIEKTVPNHETLLILYCSGGYRSAIAADALQKMGYKNVCSMEGGTKAWLEAGYTLEETK